MGELVEEVISRENLGEDMKGFLQRSTEGTQNEADALIEHELSSCTEGMVLA